VNRKTVAGPAPVELLIADGHGDVAVVGSAHDARTVDDFLKLLPKERVDTSLFIRTGWYHKFIAHASTNKTTISSLPVKH
jgi:hypothetical protein